MTELLLAELTYKIIGAAMEVHRTLGPGFLEDEAQLINYLKATGVRVGLLFNFGAMSLQHERRIV
jgi:hypothetical protein